MRKKPNLVVSGLLDFLEETGQTRLLPEVTQELERLLTEGEKVAEIRVTTVVPLTEAQKESLNRLLSNFLKVDLPLVNKIDKNLLGGLTIKLGDWFLDASLVQELKYLKKTLLS